MLNKLHRQVKKVLIFRQGSLGDTVVALPCFKLVKQSFPCATISVLTNMPVNQKACALEMVLENTGLVDGYFAYPADCSLSKKFALMRKLVKQNQPDVLVYLIPNPGFKQRLRDFLFFKLCGIKKIVGLSLLSNEYDYRYDADVGKYEYEGKRLARQLQHDLGPVDWGDASLMDLTIIQKENDSLAALIPDWVQQQPFFVCSIGTKLQEKDWGQVNWRQLMREIASRYPEYGVVFIGVNSESDRSQELLDLCANKTLNLCGKLSVRQSAAFLARTKIFIGHDSGPMHLAAAAGAACVAIFSRYNRPGCWYPHGSQHQVIYPEGASVQAIPVADVMRAISKLVQSQQT